MNNELTVLNGLLKTIILLQRKFLKATRTCLVEPNPLKYKQQFCAQLEQRNRENVKVAMSHHLLVKSSICESKSCQCKPALQIVQFHLKFKILDISICRKLLSVNSASEDALLMHKSCLLQAF